MKKLYFVSFLVGLGSVIIVAVGPYVFYQAFYPVVYIVSWFYQIIGGYLSIPTSSSLWFLILLASFYLVSIPLFIGYTLFLWFTKKNREGDWSFSFLFFSLGSILSSGVFVLLLSIGVSRGDLIL